MKNDVRKGMNRRDFLKTSAFLGGTALLTGCAANQDIKKIDLSNYTLNEPNHVIYSVCLQCHTDCPIKVKIKDGIAVKIDGNPYGIQTMDPAIPYKTSIKDAAKIDGGICPKGQAGIQSLYDPYRIVKVLKRSGKRGENKWKVISFDQAIKEIVEGGKLFADVPGEENRHVAGLKELYALKDPKITKEMGSDAKAVGKGKMALAEFKKKWGKYLDVLIDPDHPDFGPKNNQFVFLAGRIEHGRKEFAKRWQNGAFGSINWYEHTTICEQSHHIAYDEMTKQYMGGGKWDKGKHHMKPDFYNSEFVLFFGTGAFEANFGPPLLANQVTNHMIKNKLKIAVADPRLSKTAAKAWKWLPIQPGTDAALAYAIMHWMLSNEKYDKTFLSNANQAAAKLDNETVWTNSTWLVKMEKDGPGEFLRAKDIGRGDDDTFVAVSNGKVVTFKPKDNKAVDADLMYEGTIGGKKVKTAFKILYDYVMSRSFDEWVKETGLGPDNVREVAYEFARHGKKSVAEMYRGPVQHTNGYYNGQAIITLNLLVGNVDWKGGLSKGGGHWHEDGSKPGNPFNVKKKLHPGKLSAFGIRINREKAKYEDSTLFREHGYPAKRPWFPFTGNVYQEVIPSAQDKYPYAIKALFLHKGTPVYSSPAGHKMIEALTDLEAIPLFFACDIVIGESSMYADYIFPDTAIWERWGTPHITPASPVKQSKVRQPAVESPVEKVSVFGEEMHCSMEAIMLAIAEKMGLPGYGKNGFGPGMDFTRAEDFYLKMVANIAAGDKPGHSVPDATAEEIDVFREARKHLSSTIFNEQRWKKAVIDETGMNWWTKVIYVLNRGGRYEDFDKYIKSGDKLPHPYKSQFNIYCEPVAMGRHPYNGKRFSGIGLYEPIKGYDDKPVNQDDFPIKLITYKDIRGGQSRTLPNNYWLSASLPENYILINTRTAEKFGLKEGDKVRVISPTNPEGIWDLKNGETIPIEGKVRIKEGIRPGVIAISWHFGHWAYGANDVEVDGVKVSGDERRRAGLCPNAAMFVDPVLKNVCLQDLIGGSSSFYDTHIKLIKL